MDNQSEKTGEKAITDNRGGDDSSRQAQDEIEVKPEAGKGVDVKVGQEGSFMELYEESLKSIQEGGVVKGEIVQIDKEFVLVDIGYKSEGMIPINEVIDSRGHVSAQ
ncbi:MAG: S1 RNA-binding domain-containing protein, partial [Deltaproteobacteria bacterium]